MHRHRLPRAGSASLGVSQGCGAVALRWGGDGEGWIGDPRGLFQPEWFCGSMIETWVDIQPRPERGLKSVMKQALQNLISC